MKIGGETGAALQHVQLEMTARESVCCGSDEKEGVSGMCGERVNNPPAEEDRGRERRRRRGAALGA